MPYTGKRKAAAPTLGVFVPCDPRIDEESRTRAFNIGQMTATLLARRLRLPDGTAPNIFTCSRLVDSESTADLGAREMKEAGVDGLVIVPDTWFFPGRTAMALTAHFPPTVPLACVGGNNAPKPGVVGIDALVGAYAQTGRLCPMVIGSMPETGLRPEFDAKTQEEIVDLAYAMLTRVALQGKRFVAVERAFGRPEPVELARGRDVHQPGTAQPVSQRGGHHEDRRDAEAHRGAVLVQENRTEEHRDGGP